MATHDPELRRELDATLQTRRELGPDYEPELLDSFLEKVEENVDRRVRRHLAEQQVQVARGARPARPAHAFWQRFGFAALSLVLAVPLTAIAVAQAGPVGLIVCWAGIVGVNAAHRAGARTPRPGTDHRGAAD
ncbi:hypothetical protein [Streptomyces kronopolitis]|uniref:hypothetical protein n=1 Tax=Streptomyces kronopolitis TaxID=1612435 RepID=UPI0036BB43A6